MLLYDDEHDRNSAEIECINHALKAGQFCVYATVDAHRQGFANSLAEKIDGYKRHVDNGDLLIVDFMPFYESALAGNFDNFNRLKAKVESALNDRASKGRVAKALLVADAACNMSRHGQFDQCVTLERWWQDTYGEWMRNNLDVTIICAHPASALHGAARQKVRISHEHSLTLDLKDARPMRVLVAEPEQDMQTVYKWYLGSQAIEVVAVGTGGECYQRIAAGERFDLVIIDTHLKDAEGHEIAERILHENPAQKIVFTTTHDQNYLRSKLEDLLPGSASHQIIIMVKPFDFSQLQSLMPAKSK
jgi:CheY-like chemotaxis protein